MTNLLSHRTVSPRTLLSGMGYRQAYIGKLQAKGSLTSRESQALVRATFHQERIARRFPTIILRAGI